MKRLSIFRNVSASYYRNIFGLFFPFFAVAFIFRLIAGHDAGSILGFLPLMWRGIASDALVALALAFLLQYFKRWRVIQLVAIAAWALVIVGNREYLRDYHTNLNIKMYEHAIQAPFIMGSVLVPSIVTAWLGALVLFLALWKVSLWLYGALPARMRRILALCYILPVAAALMPSDPAGTLWMQYNLFAENALALMPEPATPAGTLLPEQKKTFFSQDLAGTKFISASTPHRPNILLIVIESLSQQMMDKGWTPKLAKRSEQALHYSNFIALNRITVNGIYSLLCGDHPMYDDQNKTTYNIKTFRFATKHKPKFCLPYFLSRMNYKTLFMQATMVGYDWQGQAAHLMGFQKAIGQSELPSGDINGGWGLNDPSFFKDVYQKIKRYSQEDRPWFITALTVGTHSPFAVSKSFMPGVPNEQASYMLMDKSLDSLLQRLEKEDLLENTIVFITSDESGAALTPPGMRGLLQGNHGFMTVLTPAHDVALIRDPFTQGDLFLSIGDYLGAPPKNIPGRSLFRSYSDFRPLFFGNSIMKQVYALIAPNTLVTYNMFYKGFHTYEVHGDELFYGSFDAADGSSPEDKKLVLGLMQYVARHMATSLE